MTNKTNVDKKVSPFFFIIILLAIILSMVSLYIAFDSFSSETESFDVYSFLAIGFGGLALSAYMLFQTRSRPKGVDLELPRVITTFECPKCDFKNIRDFQREDYIFKKTGSCQKCSETMTITAIYREAKEKKK